MANSRVIQSQFTCALCHELFTRSRTHEDCMQEAAEYSAPGLPAEDMVIVCDNCFNSIPAEWFQVAAELDRERLGRD